MQHHETLSEVLGKILLWALAWLGTVKLADFQVLVSILSGCAVGGLAFRNLWLSFKRKDD